MCCVLRHGGADLLVDEPGDLRREGRGRVEGLHGLDLAHRGLTRGEVLADERLDRRHQLGPRGLGHLVHGDKTRGDEHLTHTGEGEQAAGQGRVGGGYLGVQLVDLLIPRSCQKAYASIKTD